MSLRQVRSAVSISEGSPIGARNRPGQRSGATVRCRVRCRFGGLRRGRADGRPDRRAPTLPCDTLGGGPIFVWTLAGGGWSFVSVGMPSPNPPPPHPDIPKDMTTRTAARALIARRFIDRAPFARADESESGRPTAGLAPRISRASRRAPHANADQYESELMVSPPLRVPMAHQLCGETESLMKWTEPSAKPTFTPPGWLLVGGDMPA